MIAEAAMAEAAETGIPVAELSVDRIAQRAGISRSTAYRRVRNRHALDDAVRRAGVDPGSRVGVRDRAIAAATEVIIPRNSRSGRASAKIDSEVPRLRRTVTTSGTPKEALTELRSAKE